MENDQHQLAQPIEIKNYLPRGAYHQKDKKKVDRILQFKKLNRMYKYVIPFKYDFFNYIVQKIKVQDQGNQYILYDENTRHQILLATEVKNVIGPKLNILKPDIQENVAMLRGNLMKKQFYLFDNGYNPKKEKTPKRKQLAHIAFEQNIFFAYNPPVINVTILRPTVITQNKKIGKMYQMHGIEQTVANQNEFQKIPSKNRNQLLLIKSQEPFYNKQKKVYELDFKGLISEASFLNCILQTKNGEPCLVMGKRSKNTYNLYASIPFSPLQAFGFLLANILNKQ